MTDAFEFLPGLTFGNENRKHLIVQGVSNLID